MNFQEPPPYPKENNFQENSYPSSVPGSAPVGYGANPYPANPYPANPYPAPIGGNSYPAPMGGNPYPTGNIVAPPAAYPDPNQAPNYKKDKEIVENGSENVTKS